MFGSMDEIKPFSVMALLTKSRLMAEGGVDVIHLEVGEPDFAMPASVVASLKHHLDSGGLGYSPSGGLPLLREAIARDYREQWRVDVSSNQVLVTSGASGGLLLALSALSRPGGVTLLTNPGYPCSEVMAKALGSTVKYVNTGSTSAETTATDFVRDWPDERVDSVLIASPVNPTGEVIPLETVREINDVARGRGATLIVDEIYQGLVYDGAAQTALSCLPDTVVINSFSKRYALTGWRVGWVVCNEDLIESMEQLAQHLFLAPSTISQYAALAALDPSLAQVWAERAKQMKARRDFVLSELEAARLPLFCNASGAFYVLFDVSQFGCTGAQFCERLLDGFGVVMAPGSDFFADDRGESLVRLAYTAELPRLREAMRRVKLFLETLLCS